MVAKNCCLMLFLTISTWTLLLDYFSSVEHSLKTLFTCTLCLVTRGVSFKFTFMLLYESIRHTRATFRFENEYGAVEFSSQSWLIIKILWLNAILENEMKRFKCIRCLCTKSKPMNACLQKSHCSRREPSETACCSTKTTLVQKFITLKRKKWCISMIYERR